MSVEPGPRSQNDFGSLQGCFVEGSAEQRARERRIRRRALSISISAQCGILAALILIPLSGRPERLAFANTTPLPPYYPPRVSAEPHPPTSPSHPHISDYCSTCYPPIVPNHPAKGDPTPPQEPGLGIDSSNGQNGTQPSWGIGIVDSRPQPERPADARPRTKRLFKAQLEAAMLLQRVEPVYPPLARQIHREGRVELHALIARDGTIQSLQVVSGDPLFLQSALKAVRQWRYRPTILNGQAVEIDTYITVIYSLQQ